MQNKDMLDLYSSLLEEEKEKNAFYEQLWIDNEKRLVKYVMYHYPKLSNLATDMVSDVFKTALENYDTLKTHENPRGWLYTTLANKMNKLIRNATRYDIVNFDNIDLAMFDKLPSEDLFLLCKDILSEDNYEMILEYYYLELSLDEIANSRRTSKASVKMKLQRIYQKLRKEMQIFRILIPLLLTHYWYI